MRVISIQGSAPGVASASCNEELGEVPKMNLPLARREFLKGSGVLMGTLVAGSVAERAGLRAGDWVQARQNGDGAWEDVRSLNDLRWHVTQALMEGQPLQLQVTDTAGRGARQPCRRCEANLDVEGHLLLSLFCFSAAARCGPRVPPSRQWRPAPIP